MHTTLVHINNNNNNNNNLFVKFEGDNKKIGTQHKSKNGYSGNSLQKIQEAKYSMQLLKLIYLLYSKYLCISLYRGRTKPMLTLHA